MAFISFLAYLTILPLVLSNFPTYCKKVLHHWFQAIVQSISAFSHWFSAVVSQISPSFRGVKFRVRNSRVESASQCSVWNLPSILSGSKPSPIQPIPSYCTIFIFLKFSFIHFGIGFRQFFLPFVRNLDLTGCPSISFFL